MILSDYRQIYSCYPTLTKIILSKGSSHAITASITH